MKVLSRKLEIEENDSTRFYLFMGRGSLPGSDLKVFLNEEEAKVYAKEYPFPGKLTKCVFLEDVK